MFYKETGFYYNAYITLDQKSLNDKKFFEYIVKLSEFYKVDLKYIFICIENNAIKEYKESSLNLVSKTIETMFKNELNYIMLDFNSYKLNDLAKIKVLLKDKNIILTNLFYDDLENANVISSLVLVNDSKLFTLTDIIDKTVNKEKK